MLTFGPAAPEHAERIRAIRTAVAVDLTARHGKGHWSIEPTERSVARDVEAGGVIVAFHLDTLVGTLSLITRKPWAIDPSHFTPVRKPIYLVNMAVAPERQRQGIGRHLLVEAARVANERGAEAIRLDAYDGAAGAGGFYRRAGYRDRGRVVYRGTPLLYFETLLRA